MNNVGVLIASASALENGGRLSRVWPIRVNALSRSCCFETAGSRAHPPGPSSASMNSVNPPSTSPLAIFSADAAILAASGEGPGLKSGSSVASSSPPGSARINLRSRSGRRCASRNMPAAGMAHQVYRTGLQFLAEGDHIVDVLRNRIAVTDAVPLLGKKVPQRYRDQAML